jgi:hypothetical protein
MVKFLTGDFCFLRKFYKETSSEGLGKAFQGRIVFFIVIATWRQDSNNVCRLTDGITRFYNQGSDIWPRQVVSRKRISHLQISNLVQYWGGGNRKWRYI